MARRRQSKAQQITSAEKDALIAKLTLQGLSTRQIGERLGMDHTSVAARIRKYTAQWREQALEDVGAVKGAHLAKLRLVQQEAWASYNGTVGEQVTEQDEAALPDAREIVKLLDAGASPKDAQKLRPIKKVTRTKTTHGDPSYLNVILVSMQQEAKLLGLNEPDTFAMTDRTKLQKHQEEQKDRSTADLLAEFRGAAGGPAEA